MLYHAPTKHEMDLCCVSREAEIRQLLLAKEFLNGKEKSSFFRSAMLKISRLLISLGSKIESHFLAEPSRRSMKIAAQ